MKLNVTYPFITFERHRCWIILILLLFIIRCQSSYGQNLKHHSMPLPFPEVKFIHQSAIDANMGPNLSNRCCRVDAFLNGNLSHFQMLGDGSELEFIPIFQTSESIIFYHDNFYRLADADTIPFRYLLTSVAVAYHFARIPVVIRKSIYVHPDQPICLQRVWIESHSDSVEQLSFLERAVFTLGDPYYTLYRYPRGNVEFSANFTGFSIENRLNEKYRAAFLMAGPTIIPAATRNDDWQRRQQVVKQPWSEPQYPGKACEDASAFLQSRVTLQPHQTTELLILYGGGKLETDLLALAVELRQLFETNQLQLQFEIPNQISANSFFISQMPDTLFDQGLAISNKVMHQLVAHPNGLMALPGHMYPRFYARDSHWQIRGLLLTGNFVEVRQLIEHLARFQTEQGDFPTRIDLKGNAQYHAAAPDVDTPMLFCLSILEYVKWTQDLDFGRLHWPTIERTIAYLQGRDLDGDGWIEQGPNQDWADVMKRSGAVTYCQALYFALLRETAEMGKRLGSDRAKDFARQALKLQRAFDKKFWDREYGFYVDAIDEQGNPVRRITQDACLAFVFGLAQDQKKIKSHLQQLKQRCWTEWGATNREPQKNGGKAGPPGFYLNGGVWLWTTAFEAYCHFRFGNPADGIAIINRIKEYDFGANPYRQVYFDTNEWHNGMNGLNCEYDYKQSRNFTTGSGAHVWAVIGGLFGLNVNMDGTINWQPRFPAEWQGKKVHLKHLFAGSQKIDREFMVK